LTKHSKYVITKQTGSEQHKSNANNNLNTKLNYRRGTARRTMLVNSWYVSRTMGVIKVSKSKS